MVSLPLSGLKTGRARRGFDVNFEQCQRERMPTRAKRGDANKSLFSKFYSSASLSMLPRRLRFFHHQMLFSIAAAHNTAAQNFRDHLLGSSELSTR